MWGRASSSKGRHQFNHEIVCLSLGFTMCLTCSASVFSRIYRSTYAYRLMVHFQPQSIPPCNVSCWSLRDVLDVSFCYPAKIALRPRCGLTGLSKRGKAAASRGRPFALPGRLHIRWSLGIGLRLTSL